MPRVRRTADVVWEGNAARGKGTISGRSGGLDALPFSEPARIGEPEGNTSPEELLAAAHAGCYAMSLAAELSRAGTPPERLAVTATCTLDEVEGAGHRVVAMELEARGSVPGIDADAFGQAARAADEGCTFSALVKASARVSIDAQLD
ncbi:MAG: OsmC family peroxiredoxin [Gaiellaceae bacterium]